MSYDERRKEILAPARKKLQDAAKQMKKPIESLPDSPFKTRWLKYIEEVEKENLKRLDKFGKLKPRD
jgi:hypothetical protein